LVQGSRTQHLQPLSNLGCWRFDSTRRRTLLDNEKVGQVGAPLAESMRRGQPPLREARSPWRKHTGGGGQESRLHPTAAATSRTAGAP
jgi:hypothetical protein